MIRIIDPQEAAELIEALDDLVLDESAADVAAALLALEQGDMERAADFYQILMRRWGRAQSLAFSN